MDFERRFWAIDNIEEGRTIEKVLRRRFPEAIAVLSESLEVSDPFDIVYPGNPNEYSDVVREIIVLLAPVNGDLASLSVDQLDALVREGLGRCFDDEPSEDRVRRAVDLIATKFSSTEGAS